MSPLLAAKDMLNKAAAKIHVVSALLEESDDIGEHTEGMSFILRDVQDDIKAVVDSI